MTVQTLCPTSTISQPSADLRAPMAAAPLVYNEDETVAWDRMWDSFCVLASAGGPPHRSTILQAQTTADPNCAGYQASVAEIVRGIQLVSGLHAEAAETGWVAVACGQAAKARWLSEQINQENVASFQRGNCFFVPVGDHFTVKGELKNVITAVAKTTHYWHEHLAVETKTALEWETKLAALGERLRRWFKIA